MKVITVESPVGTIEISDMLVSDLEGYADYLFTTPKDFLTSLGFDLKALGSRDDFLKKQTHRIKSRQIDENYICTRVIGRVDGLPIGVVALVPDQEHSSAHAHFHIWKEEHRAKGVGLPFFKGGLKLLMDLQGLKEALIEPHIDNLRMNRLMEKCGFKYLGVSEFKSPVTQKFISKKYLINKSDLE